ncbi:hypothetical protein CK203_110787 [Vitis vinifera]|uniref:Uncharacterized protein n=1 Tax=Vitis vinifera TaxID=29760 RepID=A0A438FE47_VITVI|nr:hypothetical protein CK203_110787 [Vitis vinifera]
MVEYGQLWQLEKPFSSFYGLRSYATLELDHGNLDMPFGVLFNEKVGRLRYSQSCGPKQSLAWEVELEIYCREGFFVEQVIIDKFGVEEGEAFPNLFWLAVNKDEWVFDAWEDGSSRHFNDWEMEEVEGLFRKTAFFGFEYRCGGCLKLEE